MERCRAFLCVGVPYLEGHGDLVSRLNMWIFGVITWLVGVINLLSPHDPPNKASTTEDTPQNNRVLLGCPMTGTKSFATPHEAYQAFVFFLLGS